MFTRSSSSPELPKKSLQIIKKQDEKLFSRVLSKDQSSMATTCPSFRVLYYGGVSGSVPFVWESQPGTPKHPSSHTKNSLPPLTPPPSYFFANSNQPLKKNHSRSKILHNLFPRSTSTVKKSHFPSPPSPSSSPFSSSSWSSSRSVHRRRRFSSASLSFDDSVNGDEAVSTVGSPTSTPCFGIGRDTRGGVRGAGGCSVVVKKALLAMVGRGSS